MVDLTTTAKPTTPIASTHHHPPPVTQPNTPPIAGHSCLVPVTSLTSELKALYVFVEIGVDAQHLVASLRANLEGG